MQQNSYDLNWWKDITSVIQSIVTTLAVIIGSTLFLLKREGVPRASASFNIMHKPLNDKDFLLHIAIRIDNIGNVLLHPRKAKLLIYKVLPLTPGVLDIVKDGTGFAEESDSLELNFSCIEYKKLPLDFVVIEPGENHEIYYDFILNSSTKTVKIHFEFENRRRLRLKRGSESLVWRLSSLYDL